MSGGAPGRPGRRGRGGPGGLFRFELGDASEHNAFQISDIDGSGTGGALKLANHPAEGFDSVAYRSEEHLPV